MRKLAGGFALLCATLLLIGAFAIFRLDQYRTGLEHFDGIREPAFGKMDFPMLSEDDAVQLGWAHLNNRRPESSYTLFPESKPPGVTRIGVFGCSFVFGSEAPAGGDFPTLLQRHVDEHGLRGIEVINFGVGGYGIHQAYAMFQRIGARYALDVAIFNLYSFHRGRDDTFLTNASSYGPVHARYIERDGVPKLVEVLGADRSEAAAIYFSAIPRWRYLRFDTQPPPILQALVPRGRTLRINPFYARSDDRDADRVYAAIFDQAAGEVENLIVTCNDTDSCTFGNLLTDRRTRVLDMVAPRATHQYPGLYRAPEAHLTTLGNELVARELLAFLTGAAQVRVPLLVFGKPVRLESSAASSAVNLASLTGGELAIGEQRLAVLVERDFDGASYALKPADLTGRNIRALLHLPGGSEVRFAPLTALPKAGAAVEIAFQLGDTRVQQKLGHVERSDAGLVRIREANISGTGWRLELPLVNSTGVSSFHASQPVHNIEVKIGGRVILRASASERREQKLQIVRLQPTAGPWLLVRGRTDLATTVANYSNSGTLDLLLKTENGRELRQPLVHFRKSLRSLRSFPAVATSKRAAPLANHPSSNDDAGVPP